MSGSFAETGRLIERHSIDMQRPAVDPLIRGVPQGWEDDLSVSSVRTNPRFPLMTATTTRTLVSAQLRPHAFRDARQKLSSFSAMRERIKGKELEGDKRRYPIIGNSTHSSSLDLKNKVLDVDIASVSDASPQPNVSASKYVEDAEHGDAHSRASLSDKHTFNDPPNLCTPTSTVFDTYTPSIASTPSSSSRDGVLGLRTRTSGHGADRGKTFVDPKTADILPFATEKPFAAWETMEIPQQTGNGQSSAMARPVSIVKHGAGSKGTWHEMPRRRETPNSKRIWVDGNGSPVLHTYKVGWESEVLEVESRLHETLYNLSGGRHTLADFPEDRPPQTVLDIGTGLGLWPISMALIWPQASFVGFDAIPCQADLRLLAAAERAAKTSTAGTSQSQGIWSSVEKRITWEHGDFLLPLPFDSGVFDLVHLRCIGLGVPESKWPSVIDEVTRVLKRGGKLEIAEIAYVPPITVPRSLRHSFSSLLLAEMVQPLPNLPLSFSLTASPALDPTTTRGPIVARRDNEAMAALSEAMITWLKSSLDYKGSGLAQSKGNNVIIHDIIETIGTHASRWSFDSLPQSKSLREGVIEKADPEAGLWIWVAVKA